ncbi:hypothetical protein NADFUDRAFT_44999 [Nadsonia fulvescens var. elongata DSM 6958]|uniref:FUN14-domain-containing protein n=1 Tax=Nadsonia fulvescens var. elongata DSM 6958 TaxID=857566 RepID=A0A1E3PSX1_9ASCO|nr:hypothetical protein NADFUDRAFT_44999 [Nadsonia fulvescens var. elongata DSM 6958]
MATTPLSRSLLLGGTLTSAFFLHSPNRILNDSPNALRGDIIFDPTKENSIAYTGDRVATRRRSVFGRNINYHQLTLGSITGFATGFVVGKVSKILVALIASGILFVQFLRSRGLINPGAANGLKVNGERMVRSTGVLMGIEDSNDLWSVLTDSPSFTLSFVSSFLIAASNA